MIEFTKYIFHKVDRSGQHSTVAPLKVEKDTSWQDTIFDMAVDCLVKNKMPHPEVIMIICFVLW